MDSSVRMLTDNEMYSAKVTIKSFLNSAAKTIKEKLSTMQLAIGRKFPLHNYDIVEFEVVGVMVPNVQEMPLIATVHHDGGRKPSDIAPVVEDKPYVDVDTDRVHSVFAKPGADTPDTYRRHSAPSPHIATESTSVEVRLCAMEEKLSIMDSIISSTDSRLSSMDSTQSSMDSRLSSMENKLDCLIKLFSSAYNTTGVQLDEDDDQCFDKVGGEEVGAGDAQRIDHAINHLVPPVSISSSPIVESEYSVKIFTQMSYRKLTGGRRKKRAAKTIESPHDLRLDFFNSNKENYNFGEEMLEFLNGKEPMMNIKSCTAYDRVNIGIVQFIGEVLPKF
ncbi:hypothetical protein FNV43_RR27271 [Rhamnella rubrinervis]|uniref:Uncharacterized protein n=1 Tax=Rhamnella rubrinervis TaxID=2594499 RepID=A0A8K0DLB8_9ROSA|nr:hypothetical protein FNV43_RR27271 [Rhamnella rubrinervis]